MAQFGSLNGIARANGHASPAFLPGSPSIASTAPSRSSTTGPTAPALVEEYSDHYADLSSQLLGSYRDAAYSDCSLHVTYADPSQANSSFALHALVVSQSPLLRSHLHRGFAHSPKPVILLAIPDPSITFSSLSLVLASLYAPSILSHLAVDNCASILSTARFLGLDRLARRAFEQCQLALDHLETPQEIEQWVAYLERVRERDHVAGGGGLAQNGTGTASPPPSASPVTATLRHTLLTRLTALASEYDAFDSKDPAKASRGQTRLIEVLKPLPFEWFKLAIEDERFSTPSEMDRFNFAKKVVAARRLHHQAHIAAYHHHQRLAHDPATHDRTRSVSSSTSSVPSPLLPAAPGSPVLGPGGAGRPLPSPASASPTPTNLAAPVGPEFDEAVVLGFGSGGTSAVTVLRKPRRPHLWKVGPAA
ncbi:hypothetical protein JCM11491_006007 [Sporobolomyces phaffii]